MTDGEKPESSLEIQLQTQDEVVQPELSEGKLKGKEKEAEAEAEQAGSEEREGESETGDNSEKDATSSTSPTPWQAIFSPQYGAYYFFNNDTKETTWVNPLQPTTSTPQPSSSASPTPAESTPDTSVNPDLTTLPTSDALAHHNALQAAAFAQGIDPALAHLDPTLLSSIPSSSGLPPTSSALPTFTAKFNARTGAFARPDARDPGHLSEYERAKRMSEFYFDVGAWEKELAQRGGSLMGNDAGQEADGKKRKRPTKKDLERFKEQKRLKKIAKTAWLRT